MREGACMVLMAGTNDIWKTKFSAVAKLGPTTPLCPTDDNDDKESTLSGGPQKWYRKNDERQNKACQIGKEKNDKASRCCWSAYQKKRLGEMGLGEMRISEMLPNPWLSLFTDSTTLDTLLNVQYVACQSPLFFDI